ncbi:MAG TPA: M20/M25/M40 family metallo-hydrolase [Thermoanaerobaculia bacterium]
MRRFLAVFLPLAVVLSLAIWRARGPEPKDASAPANEFSSARAMELLRAIWAEEVPHPVGTPANAQIRDRIVARFRELGYETRVEPRFACSASALCANTENILATRPGQPAGDPLLMVAHYDSVAGGPGVSDDGMGVAALLEIARAVQNERFRNPVTFLITDGEEAGLLGAEAYVAAGGKASLVINVENRGTRGLSNMFETSRGNRWLISHLSGALPMPIASSVFYTIYDLLPNDTDLTIFKRAGMPSINFAAIQGVHWYHTPFDDLAHASPRTLQHHGDNLLGALRAFANADLTRRTEDNATYFDILGFALVHWPERVTLILAIISLIVLIVVARREPWKVMAIGIGATILAILLAALLGYGIAWIARLRAQEVNWAARPLATIAAMWLTGFSAALFAFAWKRENTRALVAGVIIVWHVLGIALALALPGAAFLFVVPAVIATICVAARASALVVAAIAATAAAILFYPIGTLLYEALGARLMMAIAVLIAISATLFAPVVARFSNAILALVLALGCAVVAISQPAYDDAHPLQLSLAYVQDPAAPPMWVAARVTPSLSGFAKWTEGDPKLTPWTPRPGLVAPAEKHDLPPVTVTAERGATTTTVRVRSQRNAIRMALFVKAEGIGRMRINGIDLPPRPVRFRDRGYNGWRVALTSASTIFDVELEVPRDAKIEAVAADYTSGLPPGSEAIDRARSDSPAYPAYEGDVTITRARATF